MIDLLRLIYTELHTLCPRVYLEAGTADVAFPYITYRYQQNMDSVSTDIFYIDIDIFDDNFTDTTELDRLYNDIITHFRNLKIINCDMLAQFTVTNGALITTDKNIKRRWIELKIKVNWRDV